MAYSQFFMHSVLFYKLSGGAGPGWVLVISLQEMPAKLFVVFNVFDNKLPAISLQVPTYL